MRNASKAGSKPGPGKRRAVPERSPTLKGSGRHWLKAPASEKKVKEKKMPLHDLSFREKMARINEGFSKEQLLTLKEQYGFSLNTLSHILNITDRSIQNKSGDYIFTGNVAEKIFALSEVYSYGIKVFEDRDKFLHWLATPNPILEKYKPVDLLSSILGMEHVKQELGRIDYGIF